MKSSRQYKVSALMCCRCHKNTRLHSRSGSELVLDWEFTLSEMHKGTPMVVSMGILILGDQESRSSMGS